MYNPDRSHGHYSCLHYVAALGVGVLGLGEPGLEAVDFAPSLLAVGRRGWKANLVLFESEGGISRIE